MIILLLFTVTPPGFLAEGVADPYKYPPNVYWEIISYINDRWWLAILLILVTIAVCLITYVAYESILEEKYRLKIRTRLGLVVLIMSCIYANVGFIGLIPGVKEFLGWFYVTNSFEAQVLRAWIITSPLLLIYMINVLAKTKSPLHGVYATFFLMMLVPVVMYIAQMIVGLIILIVLLPTIFAGAGDAFTKGKAGGGDHYSCPNCGKLVSSGYKCSCQ